MEKEEMEIFEQKLAEEISKKVAVSMELNGSGGTCARARLCRCESQRRST